MRFPALILVPVLALGLTVAHAASLPDTGQSLCDNGSNVLVACSWLAWVDGGLGGRPVDVRRGLGDHRVVDHLWQRIIQAGQATRAPRAAM